MADPVNPAVPAINPETIPALEQMFRLFQGIANLTPQIANALSNLGAHIATSNQAVQGLAGGMSAAGNSMSLFSTGSTFASDFGNAIDKVIDKVGEFGNGILALGIITNVIPLGTKSFGALGEAANEAGNSITTSFGTIQPMINKLASSIPIPAMFKNKGIDIAQGITNVVEAAARVQNVENSIIRLSAASGNLNNIISENDNKFSGLATTTKFLNERIYDTAQANGVALSTMSNYAAQLAKVPEALTTNITQIAGMNQNMSMLDATVKIATAFQMDHSKVVDQLNFAYTNFNTTGEKALSFVARMATLAQDIKMPMDIMQGAITKIGESFKMFGDNTQGAMNIMENFSKALGNSAIGPQAMSDLVGSMTRGVQQMSLGQKAFISGASGGRGGLAGAYQIDSLLQAGKIDQVLTMTMKAMQQQFSRPPVTVQDVDKNPALAGELTKQVAFLKNIAGVASDDAQAYRILEAMKKAGPGGVDFTKQTAKTPEEALRTSLERGQSREEQQNNKLIEKSNDIQKELQKLNEITLAEGKIMFPQLKLGEMGQEMRTASARAVNLTPFEAVTQRKVNVGEDLQNIKGYVKDVITPGVSSLLNTGSDMLGKMFSEKPTGAEKTAAVPIRPETGPITTAMVPIRPETGRRPITTAIMAPPEEPVRTAARADAERALTTTHERLGRGADGKLTIDVNLTSALDGSIRTIAKHVFQENMEAVRARATGGPGGGH